MFFYNIAAELKIRDTLKDIDDASLDKIEEAFTANNLCRCRNPVTTAFEASLYQHQSSYIDTYKWFGREDILRAENHGETLKFEQKTHLRPSFSIFCAKTFKISAKVILFKRPSFSHLWSEELRAVGIN